MPRIHKPEIQRIFDERTAAIHRGMVARVAERRDAAGVITRAGRVVPFGRPELAAWVQMQWGGDIAQVARCTYCNAWLTVADFCLDHRIPLARPWCGSLDLDNLAVCCPSCNRRKGRMSDSGFRKLTAWATVNLDHRDVADMLGRMARGGAADRIPTTLKHSRTHQNTQKKSLLHSTMEPLNYSSEVA